MNPKPTSTTIYLVRHGQTEWNAQNIIQGQKDASLTEVGLNQAKKIKELCKNIPFEAVFSSDLGRAHNTAKIIAQDRNITIHTSNLLRERSFGPFEGQKADQVIDQLRSKIRHARTLPTDQRMDYKYHPQVESDTEIINRILRFFYK